MFLSKLLEEFKVIHDNFYEYNESDYINMKVKMRIKCPTHGYFHQRPDAHRRGQGCRKCANINRVIDKEEIENRMMRVHNSVYRYDLSKYKNSKSKIDIICQKHGIFQMTVGQHLKGYGCGVCRGTNIYYTNLEDKVILDKLNKIHGNKYTYSNLIFEKQEDIIQITCKEHGVFERTLRYHLRGYGCPSCYREDNNYLNLSAVHNKGYEIVKVDKRLTTYICDIHGQLRSGTRYFIERGCRECYLRKNILKKIKERLSEKYQGRYTFKDSDYIDYQTPLTFYDTLYGISFTQSMANRLLDRRPNTNTELFKIKSIQRHGELYKYNKSIYMNSRSKVKIKCSIHGYFYQIANNHLMGAKCPKCSKVTPYKELEVFDYLSSIYDAHLITRNDREVLGGKELDIYIPSKNIAIEFNGLYWHSELYRDRNYHINKTEECDIKGINLFHIWEDDWLYKQDIVESMLLNKLGRTPNRIYARKTTIKEITEPKIVSNFFDENHLQGKVGSRIKLGLYYENELVSLMTFSGLRKNLGQVSKEGHYEMLRFCNKKYTTVVGGASKLFKYFINKYTPNVVISYASRDHSDGNLYKQLGFELDSVTRPGYHYIVDGVRKSRFNFRKDKLIREGYSPDLTEHEIMLNRGYYRIYNTGNYKYIRIFN